MNWYKKIIKLSSDKKIDFLSNKYKLDKNIIIEIQKSDPTGGKYLEWLVKQYISKKIRLPEDHENIFNTLKIFVKKKNILKQNNYPNDINQYENVGKIQEILEKIQNTIGKREEERTKVEDGLVQSKEILSFPPYSVYKITNFKQSKNLCYNSGWCIKNKESFYQYGPPFFIIFKNKKRYALIHIGSGQLKDVYNNVFNNLEEFIPLLKEMLNKKIINEIPIGEDFGNIYLVTYPKEKIIKNTEYSYYYAKDIIQGRFPEGETAISKSAEYSYNYAIQVIEGRFFLGEKTISQNATYSYVYARDIIRGRFLLGEKAISQDVGESYFYAKDIIKGRWIEVENKISQDKIYAYRYAKDIIKGRWALGEKAISQDIRSSFGYAINVIGGRFLLGEQIILSDEYYKQKYIDFLNSIGENISELV